MGSLQLELIFLHLLYHKSNVTRAGIEVIEEVARSRRAGWRLPFLIPGTFHIMHPSIYNSFLILFLSSSFFLLLPLSFSLSILPSLKFLSLCVCLFPGSFIVVFIPTYHRLPFSLHFSILSGEKATTRHDAVRELGCTPLPRELQDPRSGVQDAMLCGQG